MAGHGKVREQRELRRIDDSDLAGNRRASATMPHVEQVVRLVEDHVVSIV